MVDAGQLEKLIAAGESLDREFKSDRNKLSDHIIYEEVVALANTNGGVLLIGVEDDGAITGAKPRHGPTTDAMKLRAAIFNNTVPNINTRVHVVKHPQGVVIVIEVDPYPEPCATASGKSLRRTIGAEGRPQTAPFYPRDQRWRLASLGLLDFSAQTMEPATFDSFDPLAFARLRQAAALCQISEDQASRLLRKMRDAGELEQMGRGRGASYRRKNGGKTRERD